MTPQTQLTAQMLLVPKSPDTFLKTQCPRTRGEGASTVSELKNSRFYFNRNTQSNCHIQEAIISNVHTCTQCW